MKILSTILAQDKRLLAAAVIGLSIIAFCMFNLIVYVITDPAEAFAQASY